MIQKRRVAAISHVQVGGTHVRSRWSQWEWNIQCQQQQRIHFRAPISQRSLVWTPQSSGARSKPPPVPNSCSCHIICWNGRRRDRANRARAGRTGGRARPPQYSRSVSSTGDGCLVSPAWGKRQRHPAETGGLPEARVAAVRIWPGCRVDLSSRDEGDETMMKTPIHHE